LTVSETAAACVVVPLVPRTVSVKVPRVVDAEVRTVSVELPGATTEPGPKLALAPAGSPVTESETVPANPPWEETLIM